VRPDGKRPGLGHKSKKIKKLFKNDLKFFSSNQMKQCRFSRNAYGAIEAKAIYPSLLSID